MTVTVGNYASGYYTGEWDHITQFSTRFQIPVSGHLTRMGITLQKPMTNHNAKLMAWRSGDRSIAGQSATFVLVAGDSPSVRYEADLSSPVAVTKNEVIELGIWHAYYDPDPIWWRLVAGSGTYLKNTGAAPADQSGSALNASYQLAVYAYLVPSPILVRRSGVWVPATSKIRRSGAWSDAPGIKVRRSGVWVDV